MDTTWTLEQTRGARAAVHTALEFGDLVRPDNCEMCGKSWRDNGRALDAHHHNGYDAGSRLDVQWLCYGCHLHAHGRRNFAYMTPEQHSAKARKADATWKMRDPTGYIEHKRRATAGMTPEQHKERARKAHETMRRNGTRVGGYRPSKQRYDRACIQCGSSFAATRSDKLYCSKRCYQRTYARR